MQKCESSDVAPFRLAQDLQDSGYAVVTGLIGAAEVDALSAGIAAASGQAAVQSNDVYAIRNLLDVCAAVRALVGSPPLRSLVEPLLGPSASCVKGILFDKTAAANWRVPWHQDRTIAVRGHVAAPGYGPWSRKAGVLHVQPPVDILERMLTVRLHLDDCGVANGPLRVLAGSHRVGLLGRDAIQRWHQHMLPQV